MAGDKLVAVIIAIVSVFSVTAFIACCWKLKGKYQNMNMHIKRINKEKFATNFALIERFVKYLLIILIYFFIVNYSITLDIFNNCELNSAPTARDTGKLIRIFGLSPFTSSPKQIPSYT